jgi:anti-sigma B factor antagonist
VDCIVAPIEPRVLGAQGRITSTNVQGCALVTVVGELDIHTAPGLGQAISEFVQEGVYDLVIDLTNLEFLDSTGLGVLVAGLKKVNSHEGSLELVCHEDRLLKVFQITGLLGAFCIHDTVEAALAGR